MYNDTLYNTSQIKQGKPAKNDYSDKESEVHDDDDEAQEASDATHSIADSPDVPRWPDPSESLNSEEMGEDDEEQESSNTDNSNSDSYAVSWWSNVLELVIMISNWPMSFKTLHINLICQISWHNWGIDMLAIDYEQTNEEEWAKTKSLFWFKKESN